MSRNSDKKKYPWHERKSSSNVCATSLESFKKQNTATNISTISSGDSSWTRFMLSIQRATQPLSENKQNIRWMWKQKPLCYEYKYKSIYIDTIKRVCLQAAKNESSPEYYKTGKDRVSCISWLKWQQFWLVIRQYPFWMLAEGQTILT